MAINPNLTASHSMAAALSSQPQAGAGPAVGAGAAPSTPARVSMRAGEQPQMQHLSVEAREELGELAYERADGPAQAQPVPRTDANAEANKLIDKYVEAQKAGVSLAKTTFIKKLAEVAVHVAIVSIAVAATVASVGLAAAVTGPVIALTSANLAVSAGDAWCCHKNWQAAKSQADGGDKQRLIGGDSCISHALMKTARGLRGLMARVLGEDSRLVASEAKADKIAKGVSIGFKVGLAAATSWVTAGLTGASHLAKVGLFVTSITGGAMNALTVIQRGIRERQFRSNTERGGSSQDLYKASIPREAKGMRRMNSIANDSTRLMIRNANAFTNAISADVPTTSRARQNAALLLSATFGHDAASLARAGLGGVRGGSNVRVDEANAQAFASVAKGTAEDFGNAFVNAGKFTLTVVAITSEHFGWTQDVKNFVDTINPSAWIPDLKNAVGL